MNAQQLEHFRAMLDSSREDVRRQLRESGADPDEGSLEGEGYDAGFADSAHSTAELGKTLILIERLRAQLRDIDHALKRMDEGGYGTCERCGNPIPEERLEALPYSTLCVTCKQRESA
ncbi:MAG TPA: TraR/DksA C4-type zinc finger protein [Actinomycetota bacterium]